MAIELPKNRLNIRQIQTQQRKVPLEQILAVEGQNPLATGVETFGNVLSQTIAKRAELQRQGQELARLEALAGKEPGSFQGLDPSTATSLTNRLVEQRQNSYNPQQVTALGSGDPMALGAAFPQGIPKEAVGMYNTTTNKEEGRVLREQQMKALEMERERNRIEKRSKEKVDIVNKFNTDPGVRKIQSSFDAAANTRELALSGNPIAANAIPSYMSRASGEVGNLSESDKRPYGGSQAILSRIEASLTQLSTGQLTESNRKFLIDLADTMENSATNNLDRRAKDVSGQYGEASDFLKSDEIYKTLRPIVSPKPTMITPKKVGRFQIEVEP